MRLGRKWISLSSGEIAGFKMDLENLEQKEQQDGDVNMRQDGGRAGEEHFVDTNNDVKGE